MTGADSDYQTLSREIFSRLGLEPSGDQTVIKKKFKTVVLDLMQGPKDPALRSPEESAQRREEIKSLGAFYFNYRTVACKHDALALKGQKDHADAPSLKSRASAIIMTVQKSVIGIARCELEVHDFLAKLERDLVAAKTRAHPDYAGIKWTFDLPDQVKIMIKKQNDLTARVAAMKKVKPLIEKLDPVYVAMGRLLCQLLEDAPGKRAYADFELDYRSMRFTRALESIQKLHHKNTRKFFQKNKKKKRIKWDRALEIATLMTGLMEKAGTWLVNDEGKLYVRYAEFSSVLAEAEKNLENTNIFLAKHEVPEIEYRHEALRRELTRLHEVGSFGSYLDVLEGLYEGCEFPLPTMKDVRSFETDYYNKATGILGQSSAQIEQINSRIKELGQSPFDQSPPGQDGPKK